MIDWLIYLSKLILAHCFRFSDWIAWSPTHNCIQKPSGIQLVSEWEWDLIRKGSEVFKIEVSENPNSKMEGNVVVKEVSILETADDIQNRRDQVLSRYSQFRSDARQKRDKLEDSRRFQVKWHSVLMVAYCCGVINSFDTCFWVHQIWFTWFIFISWLLSLITVKRKSLAVYEASSIDSFRN